MKSVYYLSILAILESSNLTVVTCLYLNIEWMPSMQTIANFGWQLAALTAEKWPLTCLGGHRLLRSTHAMMSKWRLKLFQCSLDWPSLFSSFFLQIIIFWVTSIVHFAVATTFHSLLFQTRVIASYSLERNAHLTVNISFNKCHSINIHIMSKHTIDQPLVFNMFHPCLRITNLLSINKSSKPDFCTITI